MELRVKKHYLGWASAEAPWEAGKVVDVDDTAPAFGDMTVAEYLLATFPDRFEKYSPKTSTDRFEKAKPPKRREVANDE